MKILITGSTGLLGQALSRRLASSADVVGLSRHTPAAAAGRHVACDLLDAPRLGEVLREHAPDAVIHAQALSDVDCCEREPTQARRMNVDATAHLVRALDPARTLLLHVSTDYVFDGAKGAPYNEADAPRPLSVYGRSKVEGERVALGYARAVVVRPSTLYGPGRVNFCDHVVSQLTQGQPVEAFADQVTSPTYTADLAEALDALVTALARRSIGDWPRIVHLTNAGGCSRVAFAERVADLLGCPRGLIRPIAMAQQQRPAPRPAYSALTSLYVERLIGRVLRPWEQALQSYLEPRRPAHAARGVAPR